MAACGIKVTSVTVNADGSFVISTEPVKPAIDQQFDELEAKIAAMKPVPRRR